MSVAVPLVAAAGVSRLYLNAHWLSDVLGGVTGGLAFALAALLVVDAAPRPGAAGG